ncbi:hypothetical protein RvY_05910-2 [Ramazzottius varieornatus]|uniref:Syntaxin-18 n=1 Tax=Ramazzottius varieornatus TaxID=947166 RepID=A0A1D1UZN7_RAMVA|nr:hypothetical protein RvY_05910-2 [Ramazzottius varieornatus]
MFYLSVQHNKTQIKTHRMEILRMVEAYLAAVSHLLTELQGVRVKRALDHAKLSKLETFGEKPKRKASSDFPEPLRQKIAAHASTVDPERGFRKGSRTDPSTNFDPKPAAPKQSEVFSTEELQLFEGENANLYNEMAGMEDEVRLIEHQMTEISKLQQIFTENVLIQV